jgi:hypothetical protein
MIRAPTLTQGGSVLKVYDGNMEQKTNYYKKAYFRGDCTLFWVKGLLFGRVLGKLWSKFNLIWMLIKGRVLSELGRGVREIEMDLRNFSETPRRGGDDFFCLYDKKEWVSLEFSKEERLFIYNAYYFAVKEILKKKDLTLCHGHELFLTNEEEDPFFNYLNVKECLGSYSQFLQKGDFLDSQLRLALERTLFKKDENFIALKEKVEGLLANRNKPFMKMIETIIEDAELASFREMIQGEIKSEVEETINDPEEMIVEDDEYEITWLEDEDDLIREGVISADLYCFMYSAFLDRVSSFDEVESGIWGDLWEVYKNENDSQMKKNILRAYNFEQKYPDEIKQLRNVVMKDALN